MKKKILVVDDQQANIFIITERLKKVGYDVITAEDGKTAIDIAINEIPDLILLDVMMPKMSGFDVLQFLVAHEKTKDIPIILLTALTDFEDVKKGFELGAFDYVKKPFNREELLARIRSALRFSETNKLLLENEKMKLFQAFVVTANHEIQQPLTMINLSTAALRRKFTENGLIEDEFVSKRIDFIEKAAAHLIEIVEKLNRVKRPVFTEYLNNLEMINIDSPEKPQNE